MKKAPSPPSAEVVHLFSRSRDPVTDMSKDRRARKVKSLRDNAPWDDLEYAAVLGWNKKTKRYELYTKKMRTGTLNLMLDTVKHRLLSGDFD